MDSLNLINEVLASLNTAEETGDPKVIEQAFDVKKWELMSDKVFRTYKAIPALLDGINSAIRGFTNAYLLQGGDVIIDNDEYLRDESGDVIEIGDIKSKLKNVGKKVGNVVKQVANNPVVMGVVKTGLGTALNAVAPGAGTALSAVLDKVGDAKKIATSNSAHDKSAVAEKRRVDPNVNRSGVTTGMGTPQAIDDMKKENDKLRALISKQDDLINKMNKK